MEYVKQLIQDANIKGIELYSKECYALAEQVFEQVLKVDSDDDISNQMLGLSKYKLNKLDDAAHIFLNKLNKTPNDFNTHSNLALVYMDMCNTDLAIKHLKTALKINPNFNIARINLGLAYQIKQKHKTAIRQFKKAYSIDRNNSNALISISHAYSCINDLENALKYCNMAIDLEYTNAKAHFNKGTILGLMGEWDKAFEEMEWKWQYFKNADIITEVERWDGKKKLKDKKVLVYSEQATGDMIQFLRYLPRLKELGAYVILECHHHLRSLIQGCDGIDEIRHRETREFDFDYYLSVLSLPFYFGIHPIPQRYITVPKNHLCWDSYKNMYKVGVVWAGSPAHANDRNRSLHCKYLKNICNIPNVKIFSLQKELSNRYWPQVGEVDLCQGTKGMSMVNMAQYMNDFSDTASIINEMDLIITVDTALAHLAGAMSKDTWLLLPFNPDWRWRASGDTTIWYDSVTIFRQKKVNGWKEVLNRIEWDLKAKINN